jgi:hypothetical protein
MTEPIIKRKENAVQGMKKPAVKNYWTVNIQKEKERIIKQRIKDNKVGILDSANFAIRKEVLEKIGFTNPEVYSGNDTELMARLKKNKIPVCFTEFFVLHYHPDTLTKTAKKFFKRGEWNSRIKKMHSDKKSYFHFQNMKNHTHYFFGILFEFATFRKTFLYNFVTGTSWRAGQLWFFLKEL